MGRILPGLFIAVFWLLLLLKGSNGLFSVIVCAVVLRCADEYVRMTVSRTITLLERGVLDIFIAGPVLLLSLFPKALGVSGVLAATFALIVVYFLSRYKVLSDPYSTLCRLVFGLFYIGFLGSHLLLLHNFSDGAAWLIFCSAITSCSDSCAYYVGKSVGKHQLCPNISPRKTIEGAVGGLVGGIGAAVLTSTLLLPGISWWFVFPLAIILTIVGIAGDLTESIIKRGTGTKDSGSILAGHGGLLDRIDSLLFVVPVLYYFLTIVGGC